MSQKKNFDPSGKRPDRADRRVLADQIDRQSEIKRQIGRAVMSQVMKRVIVNVNSPVINTGSGDDIENLLQQYNSAGGDSNDLQSTLKLLELDDKGIAQITSFFASANRGLSLEDGRIFFTEAHNSTQKIINDIIETGTARIVGPDGKLYDMRLIAVDDSVATDSMPDCLTTEMIKKINKKNELISLSGTYGIGAGNGLLPNMLHGEIIAESELPSIQQALDDDIGKEFKEVDDEYPNEIVGYNFFKYPGDEEAIKLLSGYPIAAEFFKSPAGAYVIKYLGLGGGGGILPATACYANHRTALWNQTKVNNVDNSNPDNNTSSANIGSDGSAPEPTPASATAPTATPVFEIKPVTEPEAATTPEAATDADETQRKALLERVSKALRGLVGAKEAEPNRTDKEKVHEIYNSVVNYFATAIPKSQISENGTFDIGSMAEIEELGSGQDSYDKIDRKYSRLLVLADGMGGAANGEFASKLTVEAFLDRVGLTEILDGTQIDAVIALALKMMEKRIVQARQDVNKFNSENNSDSGSTVVAAEVIGNKLVYGSVGDSSIFVIRDGKFILVAGDRGGHGNEIENCIGRTEAEYRVFRPMPMHILRETSIDELSRRERFGDPSSSDKIQVYADYDDIGVFDLQDGDRVVLCSDGIMGDWSKIKGVSPHEGATEQTLTDEEIIQAVSHGDTSEATRELIKIAKKPDDRSVMMFDVKLQ